jgi:hypothetical protein
MAWAYAYHSHVLLQLGQREEGCKQARVAVSMLQSEVARSGRADLRDVLELAEWVAAKACH